MKVEEPQQLELLQAEGCDEVQGEIFSPPLASHEFAAWMASRAAEAAADGPPEADVSEGVEKKVRKDSGPEDPL